MMGFYAEIIFNSPFWKWAIICSRWLSLAGAVNDDSFTVCRDQVLIFQHF